MSQREQQLLADIKKLQQENAVLKSDNADIMARLATEKARRVAKAQSTPPVQKMVYMDCPRTTERVAELEAQVSLLQREITARDAS